MTRQFQVLIIVMFLFASQDEEECPTRSRDSCLFCVVVRLCVSRHTALPMFCVIVMLWCFKTYSTSHVLCRSDVFVFQDKVYRLTDDHHTVLCSVSLWCLVCISRQCLSPFINIIQFCVLCGSDVLFAFQDKVYRHTLTSDSSVFSVVQMFYLHFKTKSVVQHWRSSEVVCSVSWWCLACISRPSLSPYTITRQSGSWPGQLHYTYLTPASNNVFTAQFSTWDVPCDIHQSQVYQPAATRPSDESRSCYYQTTFGSSVSVISHR